MNKHEFRAKDYLLHMLEAADRVQSYTSGVSEEEFFANQMLQDAVVRNIQIYGMRNRVAHGYFAVSTPMIWDSVKVDIPELRQQIVKVLGELESEG